MNSSNDAFGSDTPNEKLPHSVASETDAASDATAADTPSSKSTANENRAVDKAYLDELLRRHKGNVSRAAHEARLTRQGLHKALIRLGLNAQDYREPT